MWGLGIERRKIDSQTHTLSVFNLKQGDIMLCPLCKSTCKAYYESATSLELVACTQCDYICNAATHYRLSGFRPPLPSEMKSEERKESVGVIENWEQIACSGVLVRNYE